MMKSKYTKKKYTVLLLTAACLVLCAVALPTGLAKRAGKTPSPNPKTAKAAAALNPPASVARRMPSGLLAWATTGRPLERATSTISFSSSTVKVGRVSPFGPQR